MNVGQATDPAVAQVPKRAALVVGNRVCSRRKSGWSRMRWSIVGTMNVWDTRCRSTASSQSPAANQRLAAVILADEASP
jgi:hypothetical protein